MNDSDSTAADPLAPDPALARRIAAYLDGTITAEDFSALEQQLAHDPAARRAFRRAANLDSALRDWAAAPSPRALAAWLSADPTSSVSTSRPPASPAPSTSPPASHRPAPSFTYYVKLPRVLAAAAAVAIAAVATWHFTSRPPTATLTPTPSPSATASPTEKTAQGSAVLTQSAGAQWSGPATPFRLGDILNTGPVSLAQGLAQIEFFSGAKLVVEGPAEFQIVSPWEVNWQHGKVRIHVPPAARGFRLQTPGMKLVDLGTEFGVEVNRATRDLRVAVFSGEVVAHPGAGAQLNLREGEGVARQGTRLERTAAGRADDFSSGTALQQLSRRHARTRYAAWTVASRAQAADPRLIAYYPLTEVDPWNRIVRNAAASANHDLDGGAVGVSTTAGRWPEKPALEFKRPGDRVRLQIEGAYESLTLAGWVKVDGLDRTYNALFLTDGYEIGEPHWQIYQDGRLMFSLSYPDATGKRHNQIYYSPVAFDSASTGRWHHIAVTYDNHTGEVAQFMDGRELSREVHPRHAPGRPVVIGPSELGNWGLPLQNHRFPIRNLNGSLDEFALYRAALAPAEIRALYESGKPE